MDQTMEQWVSVTRTTLLEKRLAASEAEADALRNENADLLNALKEAQELAGDEALEIQVLKEQNQGLKDRLEELDEALEIQGLKDRLEELECLLAQNIAESCLRYQFLGLNHRERTCGKISRALSTWKAKMDLGNLKEEVRDRPDSN